MYTRTGGAWVWEYTGLHTDNKPIYNEQSNPIPNGSTFFEIDTSEVYMFDIQSKTWIKI